MASYFSNRIFYDEKLEIQNQEFRTDTKLACEVQADECHPLHWACAGGHVEIVDYLLSVCNVSVDMIDNLGSTPLIIATSAGHEDVVISLLRRDADVNKTNFTGKTALHYASSKNHPQIAERLLSSVADINAMDHKKRATALSRAAYKGHLQIAKLLIEKHCKLDTQNIQGDTPLHIACREERNEIAELLVRYGASTKILNNYKMTPLFIAPKYLKTTLEGCVR